MPAIQTIQQRTQTIGYLLGMLRCRQYQELKALVNNCEGGFLDGGQGLGLRLHFTMKFLPDAEIVDPASVRW
jgi:hypothetical protein